MDLDDTAGPDEQTVALGRRIRERRRAEGLTLVEVAERTGLSATFISQVERGRCRPSVPSLTQIADAIGTQAYTLMIPVSENTMRVEINRANRRTPYAQERDEQPSRALPLISARNQLQVVEVIGGPLAWQGPFVHRNDEFMYVITGEIEVDLDGEIDCLATGDSLLYSGGIKLHWRAMTIETHVIIVIVDDHLIPGAGDHPTR